METKAVTLVKTSPENIARIDKMVNDLTNLMISLAGRWSDEKDYENINDYAAPIVQKLSPGFLMTKMTKRPFGFQFTLDNNATYAYFVTAKTLGWKRVK